MEGVERQKIRGGKIGLQKKEFIPSEKEYEQVPSYRLIASLLDTRILLVS